MLAHDGGPGDGQEAVGRHHLLELHQAVVEVPVSVEDHGDGQGALAVDAVLDEGQHHVGDSSGIDRSTQYHQFIRTELQRVFPALGLGVVMGLVLGSQLPGQGLGKVGSYLFCSASAAEIDGPNSFDFHMYFLLHHFQPEPLTAGRKFPESYRPRSDP